MDLQADHLQYEKKEEGRGQATWRNEAMYNTFTYKDEGIERNWL